MTISHFGCDLCFMPVTDELEDIQFVKNSSLKCKELTLEKMIECGNQPWLNEAMLVICEPCDEPKYTVGYFAYTRTIPVHLVNDKICDMNDPDRYFQIYQRGVSKMFLFHQRCFHAIQKLEKNHFLLDPQYHGSYFEPQHLTFALKNNFCRKALAQFNNYKHKNQGVYVSFDFQMDLFFEAKRHGMECCVKDPSFDEKNMKRIVDLVKSLNDT